MTVFDRLKRLLGSPDAPTSHSEEDGRGSGACKPISCMEAMARLQEYLDRELDEVSHQEAAHHFSMCQKCFPHLKLEERFRDLLHHSQEGEVCPDHLKEQVLELLAAEGREPTEGKERPPLA